LNKHLNAYALSKKQLVEWLKQKSDKIQVINLKLEHMYGPKDDITKFVPWVLSQLKANEREIRLTKGEQFRDFIYVDDVVSAYLIALEESSSLKEFSEFDIGTGQLVTVRSFLEQIKANYEVKFGATLTKLVFGAIPYRPDEMMKVEVNNKALIDLGWKPKISIEKGIQKMLKE
jgi:nucleoside-diphosphate-sugar epimerase